MPSGVVQSRLSKGLPFSSTRASRDQSSTVFAENEPSFAIVRSRTRWELYGGRRANVHDRGPAQGVTQINRGAQQQHGSGLMCGGERDWNAEEKCPDA